MDRDTREETILPNEPAPEERSGQSNSASLGLALRARVEATARGVTAGRVCSGILETTFAGAVSFLALWCYDILLAPPPQTRVLLAVTALALVTGVGAARFLLHLARPATTGEAALMIERAFPQNDALRSALEFERTLSCNAETGTSRAAMACAVEQAHAFNRNLDFSSAVSGSRLNRALRISAASVAFLAALVAWKPMEAQLAFSRYATPWAEAPELLRTAYTIEPGDATIVYGADVEIRVGIKGMVPMEPVLVIDRDSDARNRPSRIPVPVDRISGTFGTGGEFVHRLVRPQDSFSYRIEDANGASSTHRVIVQRRPRVASMRIRYSYPEYTGLAAELVENDSGDVTVLEGSKVWLEMTFNKRVPSVKIEFEKPTGVTIERPSGEESAVAAFRVVDDNRYSVNLYDGEGLYNEPRETYTIRCVKDKPPIVDIIEPGGDSDLPEDYILPVSIKVSDDFGLSRVTLMTSVKGGEYRPVPVKTYDGRGTVEDLVAHSLDFSAEPIGPEDVILYYAEAADTDDFRGPNIGKSKIYTVRIPSAMEFFDDIEGDQEYQEKEMRELLEEQQAVREKTMELAEKVATTREMKWEDKNKVENLQNRQQELSKKAEDLRDDIARTMEKMEKSSLISPEAMEKMQKIQNLLEEITDKDLKALMEQMSKMSSEMRISDAEKKLFESGFDQQEFEKKLDRTLKLFEKVRQEQKADALVRETEEILKKQREITRKLDELGRKDSSDPGVEKEMKALAEEQQRLSKRAEALRDEAEKLAEDVARNDKTAAEGFKQAADTMESEQVSRKMQDASAGMSGMDSKGARQNSQESEEGMEKTLAAMKSASSGLKGGNKKAIMAKLNQAIEKSIALTDLHSKLSTGLDAFRRLAGSDMRDLCGRVSESILEVSGLSEGLLNLLGEIAGMTFLVDHEILGLAAGIVQKTRISQESLGRGSWPTALAVERDALKGSTTLARALMRLKQNMQGSGSGLGFDQLMEKMKSMMKQQAMMGDKMDMFSRQGGGSTPMMEQLRQDAMKQMAMEQQMIRQTMEETAKQASDHGELARQMRELAKEMKQLEDELRAGDPGRQARERQERLVERMLETTKSMHTKKMSKQRKSRTGSFEGSVTAGAGIGRDRLSRERVSTRPITSVGNARLPKEYEELIKSYFTALSERQSGGGSGDE